MLVRGKRGKIGKGYSLKDTNATGTYYVVVWDHGYTSGESSYTRFADRTKRKRDLNKLKANGNPDKEKDYTYIDGWHSCGNWNDPETWEKLERHLRHRYGKDIDMDEVKENLEAEFDRLEHERALKLEACQINYEFMCASKGVKPITLPSIKSFKYHMKKLMAMDDVITAEVE